MIMLLKEPDYTRFAIGEQLAREQNGGAQR